MGIFQIKYSSFAACLLISNIAFGQAWNVYLPADYDGSVVAQNATNEANFAPICDSIGPQIHRLPGLDMVRGYTGVVTCPGHPVSERLKYQR